MQVTCIGQVIGGIIADTEDHAVIASRLVKVEYENLQAVISIEVRLIYLCTDSIMKYCLAKRLNTEILWKTR